jgi:hypothetical protein
MINNNIKHNNKNNNNKMIAYQQFVRWDKWCKVKHIFMIINNVVIIKKIKIIIIVSGVMVVINLK